MDFTSSLNAAADGSSAADLQQNEAEMEATMDMGASAV